MCCLASNCLTLNRPLLYCCHDCLYLHPVASVPLPALTRLIPPSGIPKCMTHPSTITVRPDHINGELPAFGVTFQHVKLVMIGSMPLSTFAHADVQWISETLRRRWMTTTTLSVKPQILQCQLYLHVQQWIRCDDDNLDHALDSWDAAICAHFNLSDDQEIATFMRCRLHHYRSKSEPCTACRIVRRCPYCDTALKVDIVELKETKLAKD